MLIHIIRKELQELLRERLLQIAVLALAALLITSLSLSYAYHQTLSEQTEAASALARTHWEEQGAKNQHSAAHYGIYLFKPRSVLAFWDPGVDPYVGATTYIEAHKRNQPLFKPVEESPLLARWGQLTPAFVMLFLLPLLIVWLCAGSISRDREQGTLRFVLSQGVPWRTLLLGKTLSRWVVVLALAMPAFGGMLVLFSGFGSRGLPLAETGLLLLVYLAYLGVFIHLGVAISARVSRSTMAVLLMLAFWVVNVWMLPKLATNLAEWAYPIPTGESFQQALAEEIEAKGIRRHDPNNPRTIAFTQQTLDKYGVDSIEALPVNFNGLILQAAEDRNDAIFDQHYQALFDQYGRQLHLTKYAGLLSPFWQARQLSMGLCQTDLWANLDFQAATDRYRKQFIRALNEDLIQSGPVREDGERYVRDQAFWQTVPDFAYQAPSLALTWTHHALSGLILLGWLLLSGLLLGMSREKI
jgi:ABC-2 type transport system permease protein